MSDTSRFVQIAVATPLPTSDGNDLLYALDESGQVWYFNFKHSAWVSLPRDRAVPEPTPPAKAHKGE